MGPRWPKMTPRWPQEVPRSLQEGPEPWEPWAVVKARIDLVQRAKYVAHIEHVFRKLEAKNILETHNAFELLGSSTES